MNIPPLEASKKPTTAISSVLVIAGRRIGQSLISVIIMKEGGGSIYWGI
jgi:hypothetical protein